MGAEGEGYIAVLYGTYQIVQCRPPEANESYRTVESEGTVGGGKREEREREEREGGE